MSDTKSAQEQTTTEVSMMKTSLRTHFARLLDDELDVDEVTNWFASLGMVTGKQDITENAAALTHYFDDLGFNTGEDYCLAKEEDIEAACKKQIPINLRESQWGYGSKNSYPSFTEKVK